jgi:squalene-hopene/tetraprenyl-beta-curcumene cyclase
MIDMTTARSRAAIRSPEKPLSVAEIDVSIDTAASALLGLQQADGHFVFELEADATIDGYFVVLGNFVD